MGLKDVYGHEQNKKLILAAIKLGKIGHAYLLSGPKGVGKKAFAKALVKDLFCLNKVDQVHSCGKCLACQKLSRESHPDFHQLEPNGAKIKIEQLRQLQKSFFYKPYEAEYKVILLDEAETMTPEAANSILKILEEPPVHTLFLLITAKPYAVLSTIQSRCQRLNFNKLANTDIEKYLLDRFDLGEDKASFLANLADGNLITAENLATSDEILDTRNEIIQLLKTITKNDVVKLIKIANEWEKKKEEFISRVDLLALFFRDVLILKKTQNMSLIINKDAIEFLKDLASCYSATKLIAALEELEKLKQYLQQNVNYRVVIDNLFLLLKPDQ